MIARGWLVLGIAGLWCGCSAPVPGKCGGEHCTAEQRCEAMTLHCVDDLPPVVTAMAPTGVVDESTFLVPGTVTDDEAVLSAEWRLGDGAWQPLDLDEQHAFRITVTTPVLDAAPLVVDFRARDKRTETGLRKQVVVDRVGPSVRLVRPAANALFNTASVDVSVEATDGSGALATFTIAGTPVPMARSGVAAMATLQLPGTLNHEPFSFEASATDSRGNSTTERFTLTVDQVAPQVTFRAPAALAWVNTATFTAEVDVVEPGPLRRVQFLFDGAVVAGTDAGGGVWTAQLPAAVQEQDQVITVEVTDAAGNQTVVSRTVKVDRLGPTITVTSPSAGSLHRAVISVAATTSPGTDSVSATLDGQTVMLSGGPTAWSGALPPPNRDSAPLTLRVTASDLAGNTASADVAITVDTVAPVITFTAPTANQKFNASAFATSPNVTVSWTVNDADGQAGTTTVNGAPSTASTTAVPTSVNDNPTSYTTTVTAADRAGNTATSTVTWSVDRKVPTIVSWSPAANARNVEPWQSVITFSEPVAGALPSSPGLTIVGQTAPSGDVWSNGHATYTLPLDGFKSRVLDLGIGANVADGYGNPVAPSSRRFHLATGFPSGTNVGLFASVATFDVTTDNDGVASIALITTTGILVVLKDTGGTFTQLTFPSVITPTSVSINSANVVNGGTLVSNHRMGLTTFHAGAPASFQYGRSFFVDGLIQATPSYSGVAAVVSSPALPAENVPATELAGSIVGTTYLRSQFFNATLPWQGKMIVAQSNDGWAAFEQQDLGLVWSHFRCKARLIGPPECSAISYGTELTRATALQVAMTPAGNCLTASWTPEAGGRLATFQAVPLCDLLACSGDLNLPWAPVTGAEQRAARFNANGENTLLFSYRTTGTNVVLGKMSAGSCSFNHSILATFTPSAATKFSAPVQMGNRPALLYISSTDELRLSVP